MHIEPGTSEGEKLLRTDGFIQLIDLISDSVGLLAGRCNYSLQQQYQHHVSQRGEVKVVNESIGVEGGWNEGLRRSLIERTLSMSRTIINLSIYHEPESIKSLESLVSQFNSSSNTDSNSPQPSNQMLVRTKLQELYLGDDGEERLDDQLIWNQISIRLNSVKDWISHTLDQEMEEEEEEEESDDDEPERDSDSETVLLGLDEDGDFIVGSDQEFSDSVDGLGDSTSSSTSEEETGQEELVEGDSYTVALNDVRPTLRKSSSDLKLSKDQLQSRNRPQARNRSKGSVVDDQFFCLADFQEESEWGERQMRKRLRDRGDENQEEDSDESEEIDLFKSHQHGTGDEQQEDDTKDSTRNHDLVSSLRYEDFFEKKTSSKDARRKGKQQVKDDETNKNKDEKHIIRSKKSKKERRVRVKFSERVVVKEIPAKNKGIKVSDEIDDDDDDDDDEEGDDDDEGSSDGNFGLEDDEDSEDETSSSEDRDDNHQSIQTTASTSSNSESEGDGEGDEDDNLLDDSDSQQAFSPDRRTMTRISQDLFEHGFESGSSSDGSEECSASKGGSKTVSRHAQRMRVLSKQIAELEAENVSKKDWTLKGETGARERPQNSLLEQDLDFEHVQKIVPAVTEERTLSLEALIKKRIIEGQFDDVVRKRLINPKAFLPSRFLELQDTKSSRSLTDLYEDSFQSSKQKHQQGEGGVTLSESIDPKDEKLSKEHLEITELVEDLFGKLDALSNAHFTPKVPKPTIKTVSDLPSISLESSLPTGTGTTTILAPEEIYSLKSSKEIYRDYEDLGHAQKQAERQAKKRKRRADEKRVEEALGDRKRKREKDFKNGDGGTPKKGKESQSKRRSVKEDKLKSLKELEGVKGVQILKTK